MAGNEKTLPNEVETLPVDKPTPVGTQVPPSKLVPVGHETGPPPPGLGLPPTPVKGGVPPVPVGVVPVEPVEVVGVEPVENQLQPSEVVSAPEPPVEGPGSVVVEPPVEGLGSVVKG